MVTAKHFYFDEDNGCRNFFYQIIGGYFDKGKKEFHNVVSLMGKKSFMLDKMHETMN